MIAPAVRAVLFLILLPFALYKAVKSPVWAVMASAYFYFAIPMREFFAPSLPYQAGFFGLAIVTSWRSRLLSDRDAREQIDLAAIKAAQETLERIREPLRNELISAATERATRGEMVRRALQAVEEQVGATIHELTPGPVIEAVKRAVKTILNASADAGAMEAERVLELSTGDRVGNLRLALANRVGPAMDAALEPLESTVRSQVAELVTQESRLLNKKNTAGRGPLGIPLGRGAFAGVFTNPAIWLHLTFILLTYFGAQNAKHDKLMAMDRVSTTYLMLIPLFAITSAIRDVKQWRMFMWAWMVGVLHLCGNAINIWLRYGGRADQIGGQGNDANFLGAITVCVAPIAFSMILVEKKKLTRYLGLAAAGWFTIGILASGSRGALLSLVGALGYWITFTARKGIAVGVAALAVAGFLAVAPDSFWERMGTMLTPKENNPWVRNELEPSAHERIVLWGLAIEVWKDAPWMGIGPMNYVNESAEKTTILDANNRARGMMTHNTWLQMLSEYGIVGTAVWAGAYFLSFFSLMFARLKAKRLKEDPEWSWLPGYLLGFEAGLLGNAVAITFASFQWLDYQYWVMVTGPMALLLTKEALEQRAWFEERKGLDLSRPPPRYGPPSKKGLELDIDLHQTPTIAGSSRL